MAYIKRPLCESCGKTRPHRPFTVCWRCRYALNPLCSKCGEARPREGQDLCHRCRPRQSRRIKSCLDCGAPTGGTRCRFCSGRHAAAIRTYHRPRLTSSKITRLRREGLTFAAIGKAHGNISRQRVEQIYRRVQRNARAALHIAMAAGRIYKPDHCFRCLLRTKRIEGHHEDYSKPLNVRWLCPPCHSIEHPHAPGSNGASPAIPQPLAVPVG